MRTHRCKRCGKDYDTTRRGSYLCPDCALAAKRESVLRPRTCTVCGTTFVGGPRSKYCPTCKIEAQREAWRRYHKNGANRPLGSTDICTHCGKEFVVASGRQKYCPACAEEASKEAVRPHKAAYQREYLSTHGDVREANRSYLKPCKVCGKLFDDGKPSVCCPDCAPQYEKDRHAAWEKDHRAERNAYHRELYSRKKSSKEDAKNDTHT